MIGIDEKTPSVNTILRRMQDYQAVPEETGDEEIIDVVAKHTSVNKQVRECCAAVGGAIKSFP